MYGLSGKIIAQSGQREALLKHLLEAVAFLGSLDGCYLYVISRAVDDPDGIRVIEVWRSQADHQASLTYEVVRSIIAAARPLIAGMADSLEFEPVGGKGLPAS